MLCATLPNQLSYRGAPGVRSQLNRYHTTTILSAVDCNGNTRLLSAHCHHTTMCGQRNIYIYIELHRFLNSPGLRPFGVCDHLLVVGLLIPRRECRDPPGDRYRPLVVRRGAFFEPLALHGSIFLVFWSPRNLIEKSSFFAFSKNR